ncbi:MAG: hypothetical protein U9N87_01535 [Planctomycetota bacterium]|nr:hypothetical protein [Planctomycetota bacterium]
MELNRNHYFMLGLVVLLIGIQGRMIHSIELTPKAVKFLADKTGHPMAAAIKSADDNNGTGKTTAPSKTIVFPEYFGWSTVSIGAVLILHALAMPKT